MSGLVFPGKSLTVGGRTFDADEMANLIWLYSRVLSSQFFTSFRKQDASSGYVVTAGKTLTAHALILSSHTYTTETGCMLMYGTTSVIESNVPPAGVVYMGDFSTGTGDLFLGQSQLAGTTNVSSGFNLSVPINWTVPTGKIPCGRIQGVRTSAILLCTEA